MMEDQCPYQVLGVDQMASSCDIRRAYKSLALIHHPDRVTGDAMMFKRIAAAYSVIGDGVHRHVYDQSLQLNGVHRLPRIQKTNKGPVQHEVILTVRDIVFRCNRVISVPITSVCNMCQGTGAHDPSDFMVCLSCMATGRDCSSCGGIGGCNISMKNCASCGGTGVNVAMREIEVLFPINVCDLQRLEFMDSASLQEDINVYLVARVSPRFFESQTVPGETGCRMGLTLNNVVRLDVDVTLVDFLCGFSRSIEVIGERVTLHHTRYDMNISDTSRPFVCIPFGTKEQNGWSVYTLDVYIRIVFPENHVVRPFRRMIRHMFEPS